MQKETEHEPSASSNPPSVATAYPTRQSLGFRKLEFLGPHAPRTISMTHSVGSLTHASQNSPAVAALRNIHVLRGRAKAGSQTAPLSSSLPGPLVFL